jgi:hypothetical protein
MSIVKDEGYNLNAMTNILKFVLSCEYLWLEERFQGTCFGHVFSKACQYGTIDKKVCKKLKYMSIKSTKVDLQICITWLKKFRKRRHEWNKLVLKLEFGQEN